MYHRAQEQDGGGKGKARRGRGRGVWDLLLVLAWEVDDRRQDRRRDPTLLPTFWSPPRDHVPHPSLLITTTSLTDTPLPYVYKNIVGDHTRS
jgi:hypothetical protein